jgi:hypothetical protein
MHLTKIMKKFLAIKLLVLALVSVFVTGSRN